jgi:hypothetical protein
VDTNGNVYVTGYSATNFNSKYGYVTIKYLSDGTAVWTNRFDGDGNGAVATALAVGSGGDVYVTGYLPSDPSGFGYGSYATIRYASNGAPVWTNRYGSVTDHPSAVAVDAAANVYVTGTATIKYLSNGTPAWTNLTAYCSALALDNGGGVYVIGSSTTAKFLSDGTLVWTRSFPGYSANALAVDSGTNLIVAGSSPSFDYATIKFPPGTQAIYSPPTNFVGTDNFDYVIQDSVGQTATGTVSMVVTGRPPLITLQPQYQAKPPGATAIFSVTATGTAPLAYQWYFNQSNAIGNATSPTLTLTNVSITKEGFYTVLITNLYGSVTSSPVSLQILPLDSDFDNMPDEWELAHSLNPYDPTDAQMDPDGDTMTNVQEFLAGTDPRNAASKLTLNITNFMNGSVGLDWVVPTNRFTYLLAAYGPVDMDPTNWTVVAGVPFGTGPVNVVVPTQYPAAYYMLMLDAFPYPVTVYSANRVGYIKLAFAPTPDATILSNPLSYGSNTVSLVIPNPPEFTELLRLRDNEYTFWDGGWDIPNLVLSPGDPFAVWNPLSVPYTNTFVGEVTSKPVISIPPISANILTGSYE